MTATGDPRGEVIIDGDRTTITFRRRIRHRIEHVWEAITNPDDLAQWMLGSAEGDARVGGQIRFVSSPTPIVWTGTILAWDPPRLYEHELNNEADPRWDAHLGAERAVARWELVEDGDATLLTVSFRGFTVGTARGFAPGTEAYLERLDAFLAHTPLPDWQARFEALMPLYGWR
ncbi:MAG: SRPBCC domain-containing protein [Gemmatimonadetes bacterium]|nr:SRPBCC domain-containing protein [Gemmatimonadota bacterium]